MTGLIVAAPHSGSGKTTVTLGLMSCLKRRGLAVAPFKVGPDFIDPGYHRLITGRPSVNLDGWMCGADFVRETFARHGLGAAVVVEGVMGLFDGLGASADGSTAQVAALLDLPVLLVVDAKGQAGSVAALVHGFATFSPEVRVAGVVFNNVGSDSHARILRQAVETHCPGIAVLGAIPRDERLAIPSRHLGLVTAEENPLPPEFVDRLAETVERHLDVEGILNAGMSPHPQPLSPGERVAEGRVRGTWGKGERETARIAVARDSAFCFVYEDNLRLLAEAGAQLLEFSPLRDAALPAGIAGIYLPGGYPECFAEQLAANVAMKQAIRTAIEAGMPVYAECGGFIYLTAGVAGSPPAPLLNQEGMPDREGVVEFVGIFPTTARMLLRRKALGYREVELAADSILGPAGTMARGHEFHYSEMEEMPASVERLYRVTREGVNLGLEGYRYKNCLASYVHLHFGSNPALAASFVASCRNFKS